MSDVPESIETAFKTLENEVVWVHAEWVNYRQLFATSDRRLRLLRQCANQFFKIIRVVLTDDILMSLSRLTDPAGKGKTKKLSLKQLQKDVQKNGDHELAARLREILDELEKKCKVISPHRNKRLAHSDFETAMKQGPSLGNIPLKTIEEALALVADFMNAIEGHYYQRETSYEFGIGSARDADALVATLQDGLRFRELWKDGQISDQLYKGPWSDA